MMIVQCCDCRVTATINGKKHCTFRCERCRGKRLRVNMRKLYKALAVVSFFLVIGNVGGADQGYIPFWQGAGQAFIFMGLMWLFTYLANKKPTSANVSKADKRLT